MAEPVSIIMTSPASRLDLMARTLYALSRWQEFSPDEAELVVVVDGKFDRGKEWLALMQAYAPFFYRTVLLRMDKTLSRIPVTWNSPALGINIAIREARNELIVKTDPECLPLCNLVRWAQAVYRENRLAFCSVRMLTALETALFDMEHLQRAHPAAIAEQLVDLPDLWYVDENHHAPYWFGAIFSRRRFINIGGVDEEFLRGFAAEDDDWAERMNRSGANYFFSDRLKILHQYHGDANKAFHLSDPHKANIARLLASRQQKRITANADYDWGSASVIVDRKEWGAG